MAHLRSIPHTGTRSLYRSRDFESVRHVVLDHNWDSVILAGLPTVIPVRDPVMQAISTIHHIVPARLSWYEQIMRFRDFPNVEFVKIEDSGLAPQGRTPDHLGLRARFADGGFPDSLLDGLGLARPWLREVFGYNV